MRKYWNNEKQWLIRRIQSPEEFVKIWEKNTDKTIIHEKVADFDEYNIYLQFTRGNKLYEVNISHIILAGYRFIETSEVQGKVKIEKKIENKYSL